MALEDLPLWCILYGVLRNFSTTGIPMVYCEDEQRLTEEIEKKKGYPIIFACGVEHIDRLRRFIASQNLRQVFILGEYPRLTLEGRDVDVVTTNEHDLQKDVMISVMELVHTEELKLRDFHENRLADERAKDVLELLRQISNLHLPGG